MTAVNPAIVVQVMLAIMLLAVDRTRITVEFLMQILAFILGHLAIGFGGGEIGLGFSFPAFKPTSVLTGEM